MPGTAGLEHRMGGIEKEDLTGNISYDPANHEKMVKIRAAKVKKIEEDIPEIALEFGDENDDILLLGWGSSYGAIRSAVKQLRADGFKVAQAHLRYINPMPKNTEQLLRKFKKVIVPEKNNGQLVKLIREQFLIDAISYTKVQGLPFTQYDIVQQVKNLH